MEKLAKCLVKRTVFPHFDLFELTLKLSQSDFSTLKLSQSDFLCSADGLVEIIDPSKPVFHSFEFTKPCPLLEDSYFDIDKKVQPGVRDGIRFAGPCDCK